MTEIITTKVTEIDNKYEINIVINFDYSNFNHTKVFHISFSVDSKFAMDK